MTIIKKSIKDSETRQVEDSFKVVDLFASPSAHFDLVVGILNGAHGKNINHKSDRIYLILSGSGTVYVGDESTEVSELDLIYIPPNTPHGIKGDVRFLIISSPPYAPENESPADAID